MPAAEKRCVSSYAFSSCEKFMPSRFRQVNGVCLRRRKSRYTPAAKTAGTSPEKGDTGGAWFLSAPNEDNARRAECPPPCNSPASRRGADGSSFASYLLRGLPPMADFRPGGQGRFGAFLRPQCRSRGVLSPRFFQAGTWPFSGLCGTRRTASSDMIRLSGSAFSQSHSYHTASGRKSQRSAPCKTAVYCRTAKNRRSGAESPCFAGKKDV